MSAAGDARPPHRIAIVGTGPGGFYTAKYLLKEVPDVQIDMIDRLPVPFGALDARARPRGPRSTPSGAAILRDAP